MFREKDAQVLPGVLMLVILIAALAACVWWFVAGVRTESGGAILGSLLVFLLACLAFAGLFAVNPNEAKVVTLFGTYVGSARKTGLWWANPLTSRRRVSMRIRNFESAKLKVNDQDGNPIEIAAVVVWKVVDSAEA